MPGFRTQAVQSSGSGDSAFTGELWIKCFWLSSGMQVSSLRYESWALAKAVQDTSGGLQRPSLALVMSDSTLKGWNLRSSIVLLRPNPSVLPIKPRCSLYFLCLLDTWVRDGPSITDPERFSAFKVGLTLQHKLQVASEPHCPSVGPVTQNSRPIGMRLNLPPHSRASAARTAPSLLIGCWVFAIRWQPEIKTSHEFCIE